MQKQLLVEDNVGGPSKKDKGMSREASQLELDIAKEQRGRSSEIYGLTLPWLKAAGKHYETLASGDPDALFREVAPGAESIIGESEAAKERIISSAPRGGEQRLAVEMADVGKGAQIGNLVTRAYLSAFPALATLAQGGIGFSINEIANAIAAGGQSGQITGNIMEADAAGKASTMDFLGSIVQSAATLGAAGINRGQ